MKKICSFIRTDIASRASWQVCGLAILMFFAGTALAAIGIDVNTSTDRSSKSTTIASPAFSTAAGNELLLAFISADYLSGGNTTVTKISGGSLTWALVGGRMRKAALPKSGKPSPRVL